MRSRWTSTRSSSRNLKRGHEAFKERLKENFDQFMETSEMAPLLPARTRSCRPRLEKGCSAYSRLIHDIDPFFEKETPHLWKTKCDWPFGVSNFSYVSDPVPPTTCKKCRARCNEAKGSTAGNVKVLCFSMLEKTLHEMFHQPA